MVQKYFFITVALISILIVSCRQDDEILKTENDNTLKMEVGSVENQNSAKIGDSLFNVVNPDGTNLQGLDSISLSTDPNDPPKNGTHWKESDSIKPIDETTDPPKNGTHWKVKN
jgi:hypothetical protein